MSELVDTTQMYLKSIYELLEDGVAPMRARIVERLGQSGPTVSQTTARLERDGLVRVDDDRRIILTELGMQEATEVIRKHRLAECLLTEVIGMNWEDAHEEACRWEHVMSNQVDELLQPLLNQPSTDPYGNRIPARVYSKADFSPALLGQSLDDLTPHDVEQPVEIWRIGEPAQAYPGLLPKMAAAKMLPGSQVTISFVSGGKIAALTSDFTQNTAENHWSERQSTTRLQVAAAQKVVAPPFPRATT